VDNVGQYGSSLRNNYWRFPALQPEMPFITDKAPRKVRKVKPVWTDDGYILFWTAPKSKDWKNEAVKYVVYRFANGEKVNTNDASKIVAVTPQTFYRLPYNDGKEKFTYVITSLNRIDNESKPLKKRLKL